MPNRGAINYSTAYGESGRYYLIFLVLLLLQLCPIWFTPYPAMHDYPNHLARIHILHEYSGNESYQAIYERDWAFMPNLAMDLIVPAMMSIVSVENSSKSFLSLVVVVFNLGLLMVGLVTNGRPNWSALSATFFMYNFSFSYGFVNYIFGLGVFFITLAMWLHFHSRWTLGRIFSISVLSMLCYVSHLSAFVFLGVSLACLTGIDLIKTRSFRPEQALGLFPLLAPALAYLFYSQGIQPKAPMLWWHPLIEGKVKGLLYPFLSYDFFLDLSLGLAFVSLVLLSVHLKVTRLVSWKLLLIGGLFIVLYAFAPSSAGGTHFVDRRFVLPAIVFLLLALRIETSKTLGCFVLAGLISISVVRTAEVWYYWNNIGMEVQAQVRLLDHLPDGARLYPVAVRNPTRGWLWDMHFFFLAHYATIYRHVFVPTIYAWKGVNPLNLRWAKTEGVNAAEYPSFDQVNWEDIFARYDYLWGYKLPEEAKRLFLSEGELVAQVNDAMLIRIRR